MATKYFFDKCFLDKGIKLFKKVFTSELTPCAFWSKWRCLIGTEGLGGGSIFTAAPAGRSVIESLRMRILLTEWGGFCRIVPVVTSGFG
jgi:hypothetical protein